MSPHTPHIFDLLDINSSKRHVVSHSRGTRHDIMPQTNFKNTLSPWSWCDHLVSNRRPKHSKDFDYGRTGCTNTHMQNRAGWGSRLLYLHMVPEAETDRCNYRLQAPSRDYTQLANTHGTLCLSYTLICHLFSLFFLFCLWKFIEPLEKQKSEQQCNGHFGFLVLVPLQSSSNLF